MSPTKCRPLCSGPNLLNTLDINVLLQDCRNSIANTMELLQSCTKPSIWCAKFPPPVDFQHQFSSLVSLHTYYVLILVSLSLHRECACVVAGSRDNYPVCVPDTGICSCKDLVEGQNCDQWVFISTFRLGYCTCPIQWGWHNDIISILKELFQLYCYHNFID